MYRFLVLLAVISLCDCHAGRGYRYTHHHRHPWHYRKHDRRFERLANHVIAADRYLQGFCRENANCNAYDVYETEGYKLVYNLPSCSVNYISVKIKHRVLYMTAKQTVYYRPDTFVDMRILPDLLRLDEATWIYDDGKLVITIPYKKDFKTEWEKTCGDISTRLITVSQFDYRFANRFGDGDDETAGGNSTEVDDPNNVPDTGTDAYDTPFLNDPTEATITTEATTTTEANNDRIIFSS